MAAVNWITSYPKSGNTWLRFMLVSYFSKEPVQTASRSGLNTLVPPVGGVGPGGSRPAGPGDGTLLKDPLLLKTHALPDASVLEPFRSDTTKAVYIVRNPRDIILSLIRFVGMERGTGQARNLALSFIESQGMLSVNAEKEWGGWPQHVLAWTTPETVRQHLPGIDVLPVRYEDMRADAEGTLITILDFLGLGDPIVPEDVARAVESSSLERMRELEAAETGGKGHFMGEGLHNQSLASVGEDIEQAYATLVEADNDFSRCVRKFGYGE